MRFLKFAIAVTAAIICLSNCSKISEGGDDGNAITFTATVENITRTSLSENNGILWSAQDSIDVFTSDGQRYCFKEVTVSQDRKEAEFSGKIPVSSGYCALYPANADATYEAGCIFTNIPSSQTATDNGFDPKANVTVATTNTTNLLFRNAGGLVGFKINNDDIRSIVLSGSEANNGHMTGECGIEIIDNIPEVTAMEDKNTVSLIGNFTKGKLYYAVIIPGTYGNLKIVFTDKKGRTATFDNSNTLTVNRNEIVVVSDMTIAEKDWVSPSIKADYCWPELPGQTDSNHDGIDDNNPDYYYSHTMRADAQKIRNFSCCYSKSKIHPVWVAAPMHSCYLGSSGRNDSYQEDPNIKCTQASKFTGYTKGHLIGSKDRTISKPTNRQIFYYSNIGAQLGQPGFNTGDGSWNNLENKLESYVCSDTLYQVVGCIFDTFKDQYGTTVNAGTGTSSAGTFQKPTAYYIVLLRTKKGNTGKSVANCSASELQCAAFILGHYHNKGHQPSTKDLYTVEKLEELTGLTFFVNVPNAPKSTFTASDWGL